MYSIPHRVAKTNISGEHFSFGMKHTRCNASKDCALFLARVLRGRCSFLYSIDIGLFFLWSRGNWAGSTFAIMPHGQVLLSPSKNTWATPPGHSYRVAAASSWSHAINYPTYFLLRFIDFRFDKETPIMDEHACRFFLVFEQEHRSHKVVKNHS